MLTCFDVIGADDDAAHKSKSKVIGNQQQWSPQRTVQRLWYLVRLALVIADEGGEIEGERNKQTTAAPRMTRLLRRNHPPQHQRKTRRVRQNQLPTRMLPRRINEGGTETSQKGEALFHPANQSSSSSSGKSTLGGGTFLRDHSIPLHWNI